MKSIIRLNKSDFVRCSNFLAGILNTLLKIQLPAAESSTSRGETLSLRLQELCPRVLDDWHQMFSTGDHLCLGIISPVVLDSGLDRLSWLELLNNFSIVRTEQNNRSTESFVFCRRGNLFTGLFARTISLQSEIPNCF